MVSELIVPGQVGFNGYSLWPRPILPINDRSEEPGGVGLIGDGQVTSLLAANSGSEMKDLCSRKEGVNTYTMYIVYVVVRVILDRSIAFLCIVLPKICGEE